MMKLWHMRRRVVLDHPPTERDRNDALELFVIEEKCLILERQI